MPSASTFVIHTVKPEADRTKTRVAGNRYGGQR
jgi:hypothetical protein